MPSTDEQHHDPTSDATQRLTQLITVIAGLSEATIRLRATRLDKQTTLNDQQAKATSVGQVQAATGRLLDGGTATPSQVPARAAGLRGPESVAFPYDITTAVRQHATATIGAAAPVPGRAARVISSSRRA